MADEILGSPVDNLITARESGGVAEDTCTSPPPLATPFLSWLFSYIQRRKTKNNPVR